MDSDTQNRAQSGKRRVMVVDDSPGVLHSFQLLLRHFGFEVAAFTDAREAVSATKRFRPDLLICDAHLVDTAESVPGADQIEGIQAALAIQNSWPPCKVIMISGNLAPKVIIETAKKRGKNVVAMPKPVNPEDLISTLLRAA